MSEIIAASSLQSVPGLRHGFFTRDWGDCSLSELIEPVVYEQNLGAVAGALQVRADNLLCCNQIHGAQCVTVDAPWSMGDRPNVDAMVTNKRGVALGIITADCVPVLFVDAEAGVIGAAHAGWRGALGGVLENTLISMVGLGAQLGRVKAALGPCIWQDSYEVGPEFPAPFVDHGVDNERYFDRSDRTGYFKFDLPGYICGRLEAVGIGSVEGSPGDTYADETRFFSYRRSSQNGVSTIE
ncbi:MAG: laccase domain-containing protein, partial [Alphaproteobacteria bacterium]|nr:laccase domain-containing protein [Alphaproteobacteria bacterium]